MRLRQWLACALVSLACGTAPVQAQDAGTAAGFGDWAVGILAADWRDGEGTAIEAFENARRDLTTGFAAVGFKAGNITGLSLRPDSSVGRAMSSREAFAAIEEQAQTARAGCVLYFTSHGSPEGMVLGTEGLLGPVQLDALLDLWCGKRPTVVVVSACFSGGFVPALSAPNRLVLTAARPDRTSFGCGAGEKYPYFDGCVLESLPQADDFIHLASLTRQCVAGREYSEGVWPPSEPMAFVGDEVESLFIFQNFTHQAP